MHPIRIVNLEQTTAGPYITSGSRLESLLISVQLISSSSSFEPLLIIPSSATILNQNYFGLDSKAISSGFTPKRLLIFLNL
jgi:hypothetical protein